MSDKETPSRPTSWIENVDYYYDEGRMVLTEKFLRDRGTCCGSGCRHCPYPKKEKLETES